MNWKFWTWPAQIANLKEEAKVLEEENRVLSIIINKYEAKQDSLTKEVGCNCGFIKKHESFLRSNKIIE